MKITFATPAEARAFIGKTAVDEASGVLSAVRTAQTRLRYLRNLHAHNPVMTLKIEARTMQLAELEQDICRDIAALNESPPKGEGSS